jgi:hypothetical protein
LRRDLEDVLREFWRGEVDGPDAKRLIKETEKEQARARQFGTLASPNRRDAANWTAIDDRLRRARLQSDGASASSRAPTHDGAMGGLSRQVESWGGSYTAAPRTMIRLSSFRDESKFSIDPPGGSKISMDLGLKCGNGGLHPHRPSIVLWFRTATRCETDLICDASRLACVGIGETAWEASQLRIA